jgi:hypothetical protein
VIAMSEISLPSASTDTSCMVWYDDTATNIWIETPLVCNIAAVWQVSESIYDASEVCVWVCTPWTSLYMPNVITSTKWGVYF